MPYATPSNTLDMIANKTKWVRLGDYIERSMANNKDLVYGTDLIQGVNSDGTFSSSKANTIDINLKPYKIVLNGDFVYNPSRLNIGSIAYRTEGLCIVSHLYVVFRLNECGQKCIIPEYLYFYFRRNEFFRQITFLNFGSQRPEFNFFEMSDIRIPLPSMEVQRDLVATYEGLKRLAEDNEALIAPLTEACQAFIVNCKRQYPSVPLGDYIEEVDERNTEGKDYPFCGVNKDKCFMPTVADTNNLDSRKYKLVKQDMFVFSGMQTGRDVCIRIALQNEDKVLLISPAYTTYKVKDVSEILPQFLYMQFERQEMDRLGCFLSDSSIRSNLHEERFSAIQIPLPPLEVQQSIVNLYHCIEEAKGIAREARERLTTLCPALIQRAIHS